MTQFQGLFTLTTAVCFALSGVWFGSGVGVQALTVADTLHKDPTLLSETRIVHDILSSHVPEILPSGTSYLLLGVNADHAPPNPVLEAIWVVTFTPDYSTVELRGLAPTPTMKSAFSDRYEEFTALVLAQVTTPIQKQFILNSEQFMWIIDKVGGVRLSGRVLDGSETLHYVRAGRDVDEQVLRQAAAVQALVARAAVLGQRADVSAVLEKVRPGSFSDDELSAITDNFSPLSMERVRVRAVTDDIHPVSALEPPA